MAKAATGMTMRGKVIPLPKRTAYQRAGVALSDSRAVIVQEPPRVQVFEPCRVLAQEYRDAVLTTSGKRGINVSDDLQLLLTLDEWAHPNVVDETKRPSGSRPSSNWRGCW